MMLQTRMRGISDMMLGLFIAWTPSIRSSAGLAGGIGNYELVQLLTVTNYYYKPSMKHEKGHISTSKYRIRV
jgi:hypothetical protein